MRALYRIVDSTAMVFFPFACTFMKGRPKEMAFFRFLFSTLIFLCVVSTIKQMVYSFNLNRPYGRRIVGHPIRQSFDFNTHWLAGTLYHAPCAYEGSVESMHVAIRALPARPEPIIVKIQSLNPSLPSPKTKRCACIALVAPFNTPCSRGRPPPVPSPSAT
jgi:hypothetical protein